MQFSGMFTSSKEPLVTTKNRAYTAMVTRLHSQITSGELAAGTRIPTEAELAKNFCIGINSVRRGVELLVEQGLVVRKQGSGTYVAEQDVTPLQPIPVSRDTIATIWVPQLTSYHPYFTELQRTVADSLRQQGWSTWAPELPLQDYGYDIAWPVEGTVDVVRWLGENPHWAGAIVSAGVADDLGDKAMPVPIVAHAETARFPFAAYDRHAELRCALTELAKEGARRILVISAFATDHVRAASAFIDPRVSPEVDVIELSGRNIFSRWVQAGYREMKRVLTDKTPFDGLLIGDDIAAQGVLDALIEQPPKGLRDLPIVAMVNEHSRIRTALPLTAIVSSGREHGEALVDLLLQHVRHPQRAVRQVTLRSRTVYGWHCG